MMSPALRRQLVVAGGLTATLCSQLAWVRATNFTGYDEWLVLALAEKGVLAVPHANRPLGLLWVAPAAALHLHRFGAYLALGATYLLLCAFVLFGLCRRLAPRDPTLAFLAGTFLLVWAPTDRMRFAAFQTALYGGIMLGTWLSIGLLLESWRRRSPVLLALGATLALTTASSYEASFPLLLAAPLLMAWGVERRSQHFWAWLCVWEASVVAALAVMLTAPAEARYYQSSLGTDPNVSRTLVRLVRQVGFHVGPLVSPPLWELASWAVPAAVLVFLVCLGMLRRAARAESDQQSGVADYAKLVGLGLVLAAAGDAVFVLTPSLSSSDRMQFLSGPGIALALAGLASLVASVLPGRWRATALAVLASWVVAVGTARTAAMQRQWDAVSVYPAERRILTSMLDQLPALRPNTLVILIGDRGAWPSVAGFRFALNYVYGPAVNGWVPGASELFFSTRREGDAFVTEPWPVVAGPWGLIASRHRSDEVVICEFADGGVQVLERWPDSLGPVPAGASYDPMMRILERPAPRSEIGILE
jgi:hypothetical protein